MRSASRPRQSTTPAAPRATDIIKALEAIDGFPMFSGPLKFTPEHTLSSGGFLILVIKGGKFTLADASS